jgi:hypothetical protein
MPTSLRAFAVLGLVACAGAAASAPAREAAAPLEPTSAPEPAVEAFAWDGGDVCALDADAPPPPCRNRHRFGRPNRLYPNEIEALERLLAETPLPMPDHEKILVRLVSDYLDLTCIATSECLRASTNGVVTRSAMQAGQIARAAFEALRARCERFRDEYAREPGPALCP